MTRDEYKLVARIVARIVATTGCSAKQAIDIARNMLQRENPMFDGFRFEVYVTSLIKTYRATLAKEG